MNDSAFRNYIQTLEQRLDALQRRAVESPIPAATLQEALEELYSTLEELHIADEELRLQHEELLATRQAIEMEHQRYQELFDGAPDGYLVTDAAGVIQEANRAAAAMLTVSQEALRGKPLVLFMAEGERQAFHTQLTRLQTRQLVQNWEVRLRPQNGMAFPIAVTVTTVRDPQGTLTGLRWLLRDISTRKQAEEALRQAHATLESRVAGRTAELQHVNAELQAEISRRQQMQEELLKARKLEALGTLAGGIAHDFNNILTVIFGNISLTKLELDPHTPGAAFLAAAENVRPRALALTNRLLTFASGGMPVRRPASIADLIRASIDIGIQGSQASCNLSLADDLWLTDVDQGQMQQALHNVLTNAVEAMPQGGIVWVQARNVTLDTTHGLPLPQGRYIEMTISDQGSGIPAEHCSKIFDPYFTTKDHGRGLGLAIAYAIVTKHAGGLTVDSDIGAGTTIRIYLPASSQQVPLEPEVASGLHGGTGKILVMDDEAALRDITRQTLIMLGYEVDCARDGAEALALYENAGASGQPYAAVILDLTVHGGMGGKEAMTHLRAIDPQVRAIVWSGYSTDPVMANFRHYGFSAALVKPYTIAELRDLLRCVMLERSV